MSQRIDRNNFIEAKYDVFQKFHKQLGILTCGDLTDFRCMTIGWGMLGNIWGHPGSAITVYVHPSRYTFEYLRDKDYFTVCFLPETYREDVITLGTHSGRDEDKLALTKLTPKKLEHGVGFEQAELTFVCRKLCAQQFEIQAVPSNVREGLYHNMEPHYMFIGAIEDAFSTVQ